MKANLKAIIWTGLVVLYCFTISTSISASTELSHTIPANPTLSEDPGGYMSALDYLLAKDDLLNHGTGIEPLGYYDNLSGSGTPVMNINNNGIGSLRTSIALAAPGDTICFDPIINGMVIELASQITIDKDLVIIGNGKDSTILDGRTVNRIFEIEAGNIVYLENIRIQKGYDYINGGALINSGTLFIKYSSFTNNYSDFIGGAIYSNGVVHLDQSMVMNNSALSTGGGIYNASGTLNINHSTITNNVSNDSFGGGIHNASGTVNINQSELLGNDALHSNGGALYNASGMVTIDSSKISGNQAKSGGGLYNSGIAANMVIAESIISNNVAYNEGGGIYHFRGDLTTTNSRIVGNYASNGGGIYISGSTGDATLINTVISGNLAVWQGGGIKISDSSRDIILTNATLAGNKADTGGGMHISNEKTLFNNTILAKNTDDGAGPDIYLGSDTLMHNGFNFIGKNTSVSEEFPEDGVLVGTAFAPVDPLFLTNVSTGSLPNNSGNLRLQMTSPAIDAGDPVTAGLGLPATDLGGDPRLNGTIDLGAYENPLVNCPDILVLDGSYGELKGMFKASISIEIAEGITLLTPNQLTLDAPVVLINKNVVAQFRKLAGDIECGVCAVSESDEKLALFLFWIR